MVGGASVNDPVFWLHHAFIDLLWSRWQQRHPGARYLPDKPPAQGDAQHGRVVARQESLPPWDVTPRELEDHSQIYPVRVALRAPGPRHTLAVPAPVPKTEINPAQPPMTARCGFSRWAEEPVADGDGPVAVGRAVTDVKRPGGKRCPLGRFFGWWRVAPPAGLEPAAKRLEGACSIH